MAKHPVVSREEWLRARVALLEKEKVLTHAREALAEERRSLPWALVEKSYTFTTEHGAKTLADLFAGRGQLLIYHFMFDPEWEEGCSSCSFWADNFSGAIVHLAQREVSMACISRAPLDKLEAFKKRMGWTFVWASSFGTDFNFDFGVSMTPEQRATKGYNYGKTQFSGPEAPGISVFAREGEQVFHTYSTYSRGLDTVNGAYQLLDLVPKGRDERGLRHPQDWIDYHDRYATNLVTPGRRG